MSSKHDNRLVTLAVNKRVVHVLYMCIIEHWSTNSFKQEFSSIEYGILETLRKKLLGLRDSPAIHALTMGDKELDVLTRAIPIGLEELDPIEFPTLVGEPYSFGQEVYSVLKNASNLGVENHLQLMVLDEVSPTQTPQKLTGKSNRKTMDHKKYPCPCCGYKVFEELPGSYEICPICFWQDDLTDLEMLYKSMGPNRVSLYEAQKNYELTGASEPRFINNVREAGSHDIRESSWRKIDRDRDRAIDIKANDSIEKIYYWLRE